MKEKYYYLNILYIYKVNELTPCETENSIGGYTKTISHIVIGLKTSKGTKQVKVYCVN